MKKNTLLLFTAAAALVMMGAGCAKQNISQKTASTDNACVVEGKRPNDGAKCCAGLELVAFDHATMACGKPGTGYTPKDCMSEGETPFIDTPKCCAGLEQVLKNDKYVCTNTNWKTYTNDEYGFEIQYPQEAVVATNGKIGTEIARVGTSNYGVTFNVIGMGNGLSAEKWYSKYYQTKKQEAAKSGTPFQLAASGKNIQLNGYNAYKTSDFNFDSSVINYYITHNESILKISYVKEMVENIPAWPEYEKIIAKILSTFTFVR